MLLRKLFAVLLLNTIEYVSVGVCKSHDSPSEVKNTRGDDSLLDCVYVAT